MEKSGYILFLDSTRDWRLEITLTVVFVLVFDLVVEVLHALGHLLLVDGVVDVEVVQVGIAQIGLLVLVQFGRAGHRSSVSSCKVSHLISFLIDSSLIRLPSE